MKKKYNIDDYNFVIYSLASSTSVNQVSRSSASFELIILYINCLMLFFVKNKINLKVGKV
jgi:hypothetical protein